MDRSIIDGLKEFQGSIDKRLGKIEHRLESVEESMVNPNAAWNRRPDGKGGRELETPGSHIIRQESLKTWRDAGYSAYSGGRRMVFSLKGFFPLESKLIDSGTLGSATTGVLPLSREPGISQLPRQPLRIRDIMNTRPITGSQAESLFQDGFDNLASPQVEAQGKSESDIEYDTISRPVRTLAHVVHVTRQALDDLPGLKADIDSLLIYGLKQVEERQILAGDNTGVNLDGVVPNATAYDTALNVSGDTALDKLRHGLYQLATMNERATAIAIDPLTEHNIDLIKDQASNVGNYVVGSPLGGTIGFRTYWGIPVVVSYSLSPNTFLIGDFQTGVTLFDRQQATIDISLEAGNNFTENKATIRAEERLAVIVKRSSAFVYGSL